MSDIFISYAREDQSWAKKMALVLEGHGWSVWWDYKIRFGEQFDEVIQRELNAAKCVIVIWSQNSVLSQWVREEAGDAKKRGVLVPIVIENVEPPIGFRSIQTAQLVNWDGSTNHSELERLLKEIVNRTGNQIQIDETKLNPSRIELLKRKTSEFAERLIANWKTLAIGVALSVIASIAWIEISKKTSSPTQEQSDGEQFVNTVSLLQSPNREVRVAGISKLGDIAKDSEEDHWKIMGVLTSYVRQNALLTNEKVLASDVSPCSRMNFDRDIAYVLPEDDIQAVMSVIQNRRWTRESGENQKIYLESVCLRKVNLEGAYLKRVSFQGSDLKGANLSRAVLENADLSHADLSYVKFNGANLKGTDLRKAVLGKTQLKETNLEGASLIATDLKGVDLTDVIGLIQEQINSAVTSKDTKLPPGLRLPEDDE